MALGVVSPIIVGSSCTFPVDPYRLLDETWRKPYQRVPTRYTRCSFLCTKFNKGLQSIGTCRANSMAEISTQMLHACMYVSFRRTLFSSHRTCRRVPFRTDFGAPMLGQKCYESLEGRRLWKSGQTMLISKTSMSL